MTTWTFHPSGGIWIASNGQHTIKRTTVLGHNTMVYVLRRDGDIVKRCLSLDAAKRLVL